MEEKTVNKWKRVIALVCVFVMLCIGPLSAFATTADPSPSATAPQVEATPTAQDDKDQPEPTTSEDADDPEASATPTPTAEGNSDASATPTPAPEGNSDTSATPTPAPEGNSDASATPTPAPEGNSDASATPTPAPAKSRMASARITKDSRLGQTLDGGSVTKNIGEEAVYTRLPRLTDTCGYCGNVLREFIPDDYTNTSYTMDVAGIVNNCKFEMGKWPSGSYAGLPCLKFSCEAVKPGKVTLTLKFSYRFDAKYERGYCDYCGRRVTCNSNYNTYTDTVTFVVNVKGAYSLSYDANGGSGAPATQTASSSSSSYTFEVSETEPTRDGFTFEGWADTKDGEAKYSAGDKLTLKSDAPSKTIYAVWEKEEEPTPTAPAAPGADELSTILGECVVVNCVGEDAHASRNYKPKSGDCDIGSVEMVEGLWRVTVTMKASASGSYVESYSQDTGIAHSDEGLTDNTVTLYYQNGAWVKDVADVFSISAKCEKVEEIRTITVGFAKDAGGEWGESGTVTSENPTQALTPANPTAPDGKVFKGWTLTSGSSDIYTGAFTFEALSQLIEDDVWYNNEAYLTFYPVFEDEPVQEQKITVFFTLTEGEWADDVPPDSSKQFVLSSLSAEAELNAPAAAVAPEGKQFVNWSSDYCDATLDAGEAFSFNSMKDYIDGFDADGNAYITLIAQYEEVPQNKTLKIYWSIDNPDRKSVV